MPVTELQNQQGALGTILGLAGGYLAANPQRKAKQKEREQQQAQQGLENKRADQQAQDYHDRTVSEIAAQTATTKHEDANAGAEQFQRGAYAKAISLLASPQKGTDPQAWANSVWQKAVAADPSVGGLGLTDPKLQGELYARVQDVVKQVQTANATRFAGHENALPTDPKKRLGALMIRLQRERGVPGLDLKPTQTMIADTQRQIVDMQNAAHQAVTEAQANRRIGQGDLRISISQARGAGGANSALGERANAVETNALGAPDLKSALRIVERANLPRRDRTEVRQDVMDQFKPVATKPDTSGLSHAGKEAFDHDMVRWTAGGADQDSVPDPTDPKYEKRAAVGGTTSGGGTAPGVTPGKTVVGSDGHTYQQLPNGKWKVIK
jgi:hypothetical protein